ncbi:hypothetical protein TNCV_2143771 [Trichonephila clavipes]|nr:hypothetical protein TNCV_2143771 [Trichonephila clavipes]
MLSDSRTTLMAIFSSQASASVDLLNTRLSPNDLVENHKEHCKAYWKKVLEANKDKKWIEEITNIPSSSRDRSVATFRLATGYDCPSRHLYRIKISPLCQLRYIREEMDMNPQFKPCPALNSEHLK